MKNEDDYYAILGVPENASTSEIRRAYLQLSKELHPDKHPHASPEQKQAYTEAFRCMQHAYEVLRDHRELYDQERTYAKWHSKSASRDTGGFPSSRDAHASSHASTKKTPAEPPKAKKSTKPPKYSDHENEEEQKNTHEKKHEHKSSKSHEKSGDGDQKENVFGTRADGQPCRRCQLQGKYCFQHQHQDPRYHREERKQNADDFRQQRSRTSRDESSDGARKENVFGTRADGQPCRRCQVQGKYCFQHQHQDPRYHKEERKRNADDYHQQRPSKPHEKARSEARKETMFGTRADGQPCRRCQLQGKYCFQHQHQDPRYHKEERKRNADDYHQQRPSKPHEKARSEARKETMFGTRADGQPCRRCQVQGKYCFQHQHQDPRHCRNRQ